MSNDDIDHFIDLGYQPIPLRRHNEKDAKGKPIGKAPFHKDWVAKDYSDFDYRDHDGNIGFRLDADDLVVDIDPRQIADSENADDLADALSDMVDRFQSIFGVGADTSLSVETGGGGLHIYLKKPQDVEVRNNVRDWPGFEFKSFGRQVLAPGSIHDRTKRVYERYFLSADDAVEAPPALLDAIKRTDAGKELIAVDSGKYDADRLGEMLDALPVEKFRDHDKWLSLAMACHAATAGQGREVFLDWCVADPEYAEQREEIGHRWDSFSADRGRGITHKTLESLVREVGHWELIQPDDASDDFPDGDEDIGGGPPIRVRRKKSGEAYDDLVNAKNVVIGLGYIPAHDIMRDEILVGGQILTENLLHAIRDEIVKLYGSAYQPSLKTVDEALKALALTNPCHPVRDYLNGLSWDGKTRCRHLFTQAFHTLGEALDEEFGLRFMISAVARARRPGCKVDTVPIISGPQGFMKSTGLRLLFGDELFSDTGLGDLKSKDTPMRLRRFWCTEIAELSGLSKAETNDLKNFLSRLHDDYRPPYARLNERYERQFVMVGTTNDAEYLSDPTGARRFWTMTTESPVDLEWITSNRDQLWAEADARLKAGERWWLDGPDAREAEKAAKLRTSADPWEVIVEDYLLDRLDVDSWDEAPDPNKIASTELLQMLGIANAKSSMAQSKRLGAVMRKLGWERQTIRLNDRIVKGYQKPDDDGFFD